MDLLNLANTYRLRYFIMILAYITFLTYQAQHILLYVILGINLVIDQIVRKREKAPKFSCKRRASAALCRHSRSICNLRGG